MMIKAAYKYFFRKYILKRKLKLKIDKSVECIKIGSVYGGWNIPKNSLRNNLICYLAGAGEDISFDVELANKYNASVYIFDPTPRAKVHFEKVISKAGNDNVEIDGIFYDLSEEKRKNLNFTFKGLWNKHELLKFYAPKNKDHVSHSALNIQKTTDYFEAEVNTINYFMKQYGHRSIDILKIDIEGSEYNVIDDIYHSKPDIKVVCVEFDEVYNPLDKYYITRIKDAINKLEESGYKIIHIDDNLNITCVKEEI